MLCTGHWKWRILLLWRWLSFIAIIWCLDKDIHKHTHDGLTPISVYEIHSQGFGPLENAVENSYPKRSHSGSVNHAAILAPIGIIYYHAFCLSFSPFEEGSTVAITPYFIRPSKSSRVKRKIYSHTGELTWMFATEKTLLKDIQKPNEMMNEINLTTLELRTQTAKQISCNNAWTVLSIHSLGGIYFISLEKMKA